MAKTYDETGFCAPKIGDTVCDNLVRSLQGVVQDITGQKYRDFQCIQYIEQPIYGANYKAKVSTGMDTYIHLHFYKPPNDRAAQVNFVELAKRADDPLNDIYNTKYYNTL